MGFFTDFLDKILYEAFELWGGLLGDIGETAFYVERSIDNIFSADKISSIYNFICAFAVSLIILKMLKKGFMTYILWRDGDADAPVQQSVISLILAVVVAISFPTLYEWYAQVSLWLVGKVIGLSFEEMHAFSSAWISFDIKSDTLVFAIITLIYIIMMFILYLQFFKRGAEMLILRLGFPLACLGLLDSDNGVFTATIKVFVQVSLTSVVQLFLMNLSAVAFVNSGKKLTILLFCIACCTASFATPKLLQFITLPQGGGGGMYKVTSTVHTASMIKSLMPK